MLHRNTKRILLITLNFVKPYRPTTEKCVAPQQQHIIRSSARQGHAGRLPNKGES